MPPELSPEDTKLRDQCIEMMRYLKVDSFSVGHDSCGKAYSFRRDGTFTDRWITPKSFPYKLLSQAVKEEARVRLTQRMIRHELQMNDLGFLNLKE